MPEEPIRRRKLSHEVLERLLGKISSGGYPVGSTLPSERELMEHFAVGRPAVREALQALERMGFIRIVHGEGAYVMPLTLSSVIGQISQTAMHLLENSENLLEHLKSARSAFEVGMVRMAAKHRTDENIDTLRQALEANRACLSDSSRFLATDMAFHQAIATVTGNLIYPALSQAMLEWLERFYVHLLRNPGSEQIVFAEHERILERIEAQDPDGAASAMVEHLTRANHLYRRDKPA